MFNLPVLAVNYIFTMVSVLFLVLFAQIIYNLKFKYSRVIFYVLFVGLVSSIVVFFVNYLGINIGSILLFILTFLFSSVILMKLAFKLGFLQSMVCAGIYALILAIGFFVTYFIQNMFGVESRYVKESFWRLIFGHVILNTVNVAVYTTIRSFKLILRYPKEIKIKAYLLNTFYVVLAILLAACNIWYFYNLPSREINGILFIFNTILLMLFFIFGVLNTNAVFKFECKSQELDYQVFYNKTLDGLMIDLRAFKHNYENTLASIKSLIEAGQIDELERYINETVEKKNRIDVISNLMLLNIKNAGVLGIITSKAEYAKKLGVEIKIFVEDEINEINIRISDLCELLGILLDNAVESACESQGKFINFNIGKDEKVITFSIENSVSIKPQVGRIFEKGFSTKGDNRGLGLWILNNIVNSYSNVLLNTFAEEKVFRQELIIN